MEKIFFSVGQMSFNGLRLEYSLEGSSNLCSWKDKTKVVLGDNGILEYTKTYIPKPAALDT